MQTAIVEGLLCRVQPQGAGQVRTVPSADERQSHLAIVDTNVDTVINNAMYPGIIRFGGNTGTTNSFVGVDTGDLTSGAFNGQSLLQGNNLACFFLQASQAGLADAAFPLLQPVGQITSFLQENLGPQASALGCPQLASFSNELFQKYPGAGYKAPGQ